MGDMGDYWRDVKPDMKERSQRKRAANRKSGATILHAAGVPFESKNGGAHLIVQARDHVVDYWPGTGKWATRGHQFTLVGRGIAGLMQHIKGQKS
ncbi:hypothetical protein ABRZ04_04280 [Castellaniella ginsengisoli]|uniref:Uncharacterized protein n=1 Tax=Castellaniella ginsengisoli TaxID=546114 RepID=A0AB39D2Q6_9BURK